MKTDSTQAFGLDSSKRALLESMLREEGLESGGRLRIQRRKSNDELPLSWAQQRLWFLDQLAPADASYNVDAAIRLSFPLDAGALHRTYNEIVRRHESLRTRFVSVDGRPVQIVAPSLEIPLPVIDLSALPEPERDAEACRLAIEEARRPFDLASGPLIRTTLLRLGDMDHVLLATMHHIVADGWSLRVFSREFGELYPAFCEGRPSSLPELEIQYGDYALWQREYFQGEVLEEQLAFWRRYIADASDLRLPADFPRPASQSFAGRRQLLTIPSALSEQLRSISRREESTLFVTLLAAFAVLLQRYCGQDDIVVGTPVANRNRSELEPLIGFFVNIIVLRIDTSGDPCFTDLVKRVRQFAFEAYEHQDLPFARLVEELQPDRVMGRNPLHQVSFQLFSEMNSGLETGRSVETIEIERGTAALDLAFDMWEAPDGLMLRVEYSTELFEDRTVSGMMEHFRVLLRDIASNPSRRLSEFRILTDDEQRRLMSESQGPTVSYSAPDLLHRFIEKQALQTPEVVALRTGRESVRYRELNERANQVAHALLEMGVTAEPVAICLERSPAAVASILGVLKAGAAWVPLDPSYPTELLTTLLVAAQPAALITTQELIQRLSFDSSRVLLMDRDADKIGSQSREAPEVSVTGSSLAYIIYTSGSTGRPKGVMIEHRAIANQLHWMQSSHPIVSDDRVVSKYSLSFDASIVEMFATLAAGAELILADTAAQKDPGALARLMADHRVTVLDTVPSLLRELLLQRVFVQCKSLRRVICGGEPMAPDLLQKLFDVHDVEFSNMYGPTEATITALAWTTRGPEVPRSVPVGRPIANSKAYVVDAALNLVPRGGVGELAIGGIGLARGYWRDAMQTLRYFVSDPFDSQQRLYRTGDLVRFRSDGHLEFLGRADNQIKLRGLRIEPAEIEQGLQLHPAVQEAAVIRQGDGIDGTLVAYVAARTDRPEIWPSVGEYSVYDELMYYAMTHDDQRNRRYRAAIRKHVRGRTVVDIGAGADAILSRFCVESGASHVYAVELMRESSARARAQLASLGYLDRVTLICSDSADVELPEKVDVCVSEVLGTIGSSEGVVPILNDARRFLKPGGRMIPALSVTRIAGVSLPESLAADPRFTELSSRYAEAVFRTVGRPFDLRVCIDRFPQDHIISDSQEMERLDFSGIVQMGYRQKLRLTIQKQARLDGLLLWLTLHVDEEEYLDVLAERFSWLPMFVPVFSPGIGVSAGDALEVEIDCVYPQQRRFPDYVFRGRVVSPSAEPKHFECRAAYKENPRGQNAFYQDLLNSLERKSFVRASDDASGLVRELRDIALERLPAHMVPSTYVVLNALPRTPNGKLNRRALSAGRSRPGDSNPPASDLERIVAETFASVLGLEAVDRDADFFQLGGHSLIATRAVAQLRDRLRMDVPLESLFEYPTPAELASEIAATRRDGSAASWTPESVGPTAEVGPDQMLDADIDLMLKRLLAKGESL
jgi:amino acid adenylation domain-containing protein